MQNFLGKLKLNLSLIKQGMEISDDDIFLKKYDKDGNSIFSKEEIEFLNNDLLIHAAKDGNKEELTEQEALEFYNAAVDESERVEKFKEGENPVLNWLEKQEKKNRIQTELKQTTERNFSDSDLEYLSYCTDEEFSIIKKLIEIDKDSRFSGIEYYIIANRIEEEDLGKVQKLINMKEREFPFNSIAISDLAELSDEEIEKVRFLSSIPGRNHIFSVSELKLLIKIPESELNKYIEKNPNFGVKPLTTKHIAFSELETDEKFVYNVFDTEIGEWVESRTKEIKKNISTETIKNTKNNIVQILVSDNTTGEYLKETIQRSDTNGNIISTETITRGSYGMNSSITDKNGKQYPVQWEENNPETGTKTVQKNFVSPDGTKTNYYFEETHDGIKISEYKVTDKDGNILMEEKSTLSPVKGNPNKFISSFNGNIYEIEHKDGKIYISDKTSGERGILDLDKLTADKSENIINLLKKFSGPNLMKMVKMPISFANDDFEPGLWDNRQKVLYIGENDMFLNDEEQFSVIMHEFGHFLDTDINSEEFGIISQNPELKKLHDEELKRMEKDCTVKQLQFVDYFTYTDEITANAESTAESNLSRSSAITSRRAFYFQKYFPKYIAKAAELLNAR